MATEIDAPPAAGEAGTTLTGLTTTGANVFQSRIRPVEAASLPCLLVHSRSETVEGASIHSPRPLNRTVTIEVAAVARATADLDDTLDGICKEVEIALAAVPSALRTLCEDIVLQSTDIELSDDAEKPVGVARMSYQVNYFTMDNAPDAAL